ncbi:unnamed protein product [Anisakis simplex]|uniref:G_PROTEIN_RECEP_F1_2 domain-containing protein n=1 Tax=Anisakis simplex TaxID=6269 RepID=A0A0M3JYL4_ANISI|nr:unnamed protein product [Anisakis simplex]
MRARKYGYVNFMCSSNNEQSCSFLARFATALHYHVKLILYMGHVALAANRLSAIILPLRYELIWTRSRLRIFWVCQWIFPMAITLPIVCDSDRLIRMIYRPEQNALRLEFDEATFQERSTTWLAELRLMIATFTVYVVVIIDMIAQLLVLIFSANDQLETALMINGWTYPMIDAFCMSQPWTLVIASGLIRRCICELFGCNKSPTLAYPLRSNTKLAPVKHIAFNFKRVAVAELSTVRKFENTKRKSFLDRIR